MPEESWKNIGMETRTLIRTLKRTIIRNGQSRVLYGFSVLFGFLFFTGFILKPRGHIHQILNKKNRSAF